MLRVTLAQMRRSLGRLTAAGIAIAIGTAFVTATLITGNIISRTTSDAVTARYGDADLVVTGNGAAGLLPQIQQIPGVESASRLLIGRTQVEAGGHGESLTLVAQAPDPSFDTLVPVEGELARSGQIALPAETADRLHVGVGDTVQVTYVPPDAQDEKVEQVTVSGIVDDPAGAWTNYGGAGSAVAADLSRWDGGSPIDTETVLVRSNDPSATQYRIRSIDVSHRTKAPQVLTKQEAADQAVSRLSQDGTNFVVALVLGFAAVALLVAGLVIANTFQVLVAQRTRTLALLRCIGARRSQLRGSVVLEATLLGLGSSIVGVLAGAGLAQGALWVLDSTRKGGSVPSTIVLTVATVAVPILVGTAVTVLSSLVPARAATRVTPVAALRPADAPPVRSTAGVVRVVISAVLTIGGLVGLLAAVGMSHLGDPLFSLAIGIMCGAASFVGILLGAVLWLPKVVGLAGRVLAGTGSSARLAAANSVRNPRRTAATSTALLIGVTLVALMSTGAASARSSVTDGLDQHYAVDVQVTSTATTDDGEMTALPDGTIQQVTAVDGVRDAVALTSTTLTFASGESREAVAIEPDRARAILRDPGLVDHLDDGVVLVPPTSADASPAETTAHGGVAAVGGAEVPVTVFAVDNLSWSMPSIVTPATMARLAPDAAASTLWVRLDGGANPATVLDDLRDVLGSDVYVESAGAERASYESTIDQLLAIVLALLAVAVLIALIGVANTLSLSVLERRRESATLRAIGLSRRQLRLSLGIEGMLIAGVGALLGVLLGLLYGWAGAAIVFGSFGDLHLAVPWLDLVLVLAVAVAAGLLASVLPARRAARTSPVAALAVD